MIHDIIDTPIGLLTLVSDGESIVALQLPMHRGEPAVHDPLWKRNAACSLFGEARAQLAGYFSGERTTFDLPLKPFGTAFQRQAWAELCRIPFGETVSYGEQARRMGKPNASRAVGMANGRNPIAILIPCHRVIGSDGSLTGFGGGIDLKRQLLTLERSAMRRAPVESPLAPLFENVSGAELFAQAAGT